MKNAMVTRFAFLALFLCVIAGCGATTEAAEPVDGVEADWSDGRGPEEKPAAAITSSPSSNGVGSSTPSGSYGGTRVSGPTRPHTGGPVRVRGYTRKDGTYVPPHTRSRPRK